MKEGRSGFEKILPAVAAGIVAGCSVPPSEVASGDRRPVECSSQPCPYEIAVEKDVAQIEETQGFKLLNSMALQLHYALAPKDFVPCFVRVNGHPYPFYNREGFRSGALTVAVATPSEFVSDAEFLQAQNQAQTELAKRVGFPVTFGAVPEKKSSAKPEEFLVNDPILGRSFDAGLLSSSVSLQGPLQGMPSQFSKLSTEEKSSVLVPMLERETLRTILFPGNVPNGNSLMGPGFETGLASYKADLGKGTVNPDITAYLKLDAIENDTSTALAHSVAGSYGHGLPK